jgi:DNA-binding NarL/FixJ family response regulator
MNRIQILLVEEDVLLREAVGRLLQAETDLAVVAQCGTQAEAIEALSRTPVDLVLIEAGPEFVTHARAAGYEGKFLLMATDLNRQSSVKALQLGVSGIFLKSRGLEKLLRAIRLVASGEAWVERDMVQVLANGVDESVTERERQVLQGVLDGLTNKALAERMGVPEATVKAALRRLYRRSGAQSRAQLVRASMEGSFGMRGWGSAKGKRWNT